MHPGDIVAGKYRVASVLGRSRGVLLEAHHTEFDQRVVIRMLSPALCDAKEVERFRREARTLSKLESEHVARIIDVGTHSDGSFFLVRQHLEGQDLATRIQQRGAVSFEEAILYTLQACEAVQECHSHKIILRELQPSHLFLTTKRGGAPVVKLIDFGTAKVMKDPGQQGPINGEMTATVMFGMSPYSSPELIRKLGDTDGRTDVWSMGCVLYEMLSAVCAFQGEMAELMLHITRDEPMPLSQLRPDIPHEIDQVISWALAKDPGSRFNSMYALAHALKPYADAEGQVLIDQIGRLAHTQEPSKGERAISPTSPLAKRPSHHPPPGGSGRLADLESTVLYDTSAAGLGVGDAEHEFEKTAFLGGSQPPPAYPSGHGSVPPPAYPSGHGSVHPPPPPAYPSGHGSVPPPAYPSGHGSVHPPPIRPSGSDYGSVHPQALSAPTATGTGNFSSIPDYSNGTGGYPSSAAVQPRQAGRQRRVAVFAIVGSLVLLPVLVFVLIFALKDGAEETALASAETSVAETSQPSTNDDGNADDLNGDPNGDPSAAGAGGSAAADDPPPDSSAEASAIVAQAPPPPRRPTVGSLAPRRAPPPPPPKKKAPPPPPPPKKKAPPPPKKKASGGKGTLVAIAIGGSCRFAVDGASKGTKSSIRMKVSTGAHTVSCTHKGATRTQRVKVGSTRPGIASFKLN